MKFYTRKDWGAVPAKAGPGGLVAGTVRGLALHWPGMATPRHTPAQVAQSLRAWQRFHMVTKGWSDIAYQEAVDQAGNVWVLRGLGRQSGANGDQTVNRQYGALLLVLAPGEAPSPAMVATVRARVTEFRRRFPGADAVVGHADIRHDPTQCPGPLTRAALAAGKFTPPKEKPAVPVHNNVTRARERLDAAAGLIAAARKDLDEADPGRTVVHAGAVRAEALRSEVRDLLTFLPAS